ncbi:Gamma-glutamyl hydrolase 2 [Cucurbita argyrosperma subsp. argyrosperma]|nr:Gamma-glutamyl hydrolase 2 [Cucurbita argyrosperma subsp. argyrosperma]
MLKEVDGAGRQSHCTFSPSPIFIFKYLWISFLIVFSLKFSLVDAANSFPNILMPSQFVLDSSPSCTKMDLKLNYHPVIGILSHPGDGASGRLSNATNASYIAASYVKFVESAGARVIPIIYTEPLEVIFEKLDLVNGVLFTGGWAKKGLYYSVVEKIFKKILERNDAGERFPLYAVCLGTVFQRFPPYLLEKLSTDCIVMQNHRFGISPGRFEQNKELSSFFQILTTSNDIDNKKNTFEWGYSMIPHTEYAVEVTQHVANHLVREARKSSNRPPAQKVLESIIYNYSPTFGGKAGKGFDEVYIFT